MATKAEDPPAPAPSAVPAPAGGDPPAAAELFDKRKEKNDEKQEESRETKRRRTTRQLSLEKLPPNSSPSAEELSGRENGPGPQGFSFSFDTRIPAPIETTPKFGSFNFSLDLAGLENNYGDHKLAKEAEEGQEDKNDDAEGKIGI